jgi:hypothetical protein
VFERGVLDRGVFDLGVFDLGVFDLGVFDRGVFDLGVFDRGVFDRGVECAAEAAGLPPKLSTRISGTSLPVASRIFSFCASVSLIFTELAIVVSSSLAFLHPQEQGHQTYFSYVNCSNGLRRWQQPHARSTVE